MEVRRVDPDEWAVLRTVRLAALAEAPYAFASTHEREASFPDSVWRERAGTAVWFLGVRDGRPAGLAAVITDPEDPPTDRHLISMWVAPADRGSGLADRLLGAACDWAGADGARTVTLWVADGNPRARRFYERHGFRGTGVRQPLPSAPQVEEERLVRVL